MPDVLIRNISAEDLARIDARAARLGLSRTEYLRRRVRQDAAQPDASVTIRDLEHFAGIFRDLADEDVIGQAWS